MESTEPIEGLLRQSLAPEIAPMLSPNFQQQLEARLPPRRLHKKQRQFLMAYTLTALAVSVGALQLMGFSIGLTLLCVLVPLGIVATTLWRHLLQLLGKR